MDGDQKAPSAEEPEESAEPEPNVPDKQVYRWKDDGGASAPEPDSEPRPDKR